MLQVGAQHICQTFLNNIRFNMRTLQKYREEKVPLGSAKHRPLLLHFFEEYCNSAAEDNLADPRKILRNLQNKDVLLADEQGRR